MKKLFVSAFVALSMFAFVACESNPAIKASKKFLDEPTFENLMAIQNIEDEMDEKDLEEYEEWLNNHKDEIKEAAAKIVKF
jgi:uncharacterized protein YcfL